MTSTDTRFRQCGRQAIGAVLERRRPERIVYAPNYWQWFSHHRRHATLPPDVSHCDDQLSLLRHLAVDVFSRNTYCDQWRCWFGGLGEIQWEGVQFQQTETAAGDDLVFEQIFRTAKGDLSQRQRYVHDQSTLVQEKFIVDDYSQQLNAYTHLVNGRHWRFQADRYQQEQLRVGDSGIVIAGELYSPLKMLHFDLGPENTTFLLMDHAEEATELLAVHERAQLDLVRQMAEAGVPAVMAMDNIDTAFHPPNYIEQYSASFYENASRICHEHSSTFFIHACGQQRANLRLIASLGVDGLEGVASPPLGDVQLDEAFSETGDRFIITGGISASEMARLKTQDEVFAYVEQLFDRLRPFAHRWVFASSCNTAIDSRWETLVWFRDAWRQYGSLT